MSDKVKVLIGIQARSTSSRLPDKARKLVCGIPMLDRVIKNAKRSQGYINSKMKYNTFVELALLIPVGDSLADEYRGQCTIVEGPEDDVLTRYHMAMTTFQPEYIVRITADCPLLPPEVISGHITRAVNHQIDYVSNVDPETRTYPDGFDCECISNRLMNWVNTNAQSAYDREHVTTLIRSNPPPWAAIRDVHARIDCSHMKLSIDTKDELFEVNTYHDCLGRKYERSTKKHGGMFIL